MRRTQRQRVTGLIVNEDANVPREYVRSLRNVLYIWERYGERDALESFERCQPHRNWPPGKPPPDTKRVIAGRVQHVGSVKGWSSTVYRDLAIRLQSLDSGFQPRTLLTLHGPQEVRIYTEGPSDLLHIAAAASYFHGRGEFSNLEIVVMDDSAGEGDQNLLTKCRGLALSPQPIPCVCIFDRDNDGVLRDAVGGSDFKNHGNGVGAIAVVSPSWREPTEALCIELLYPDADLSLRGTDGRRLYLGREFDSRTGQHVSEHVHVTHPGRTTLIREDVYRFGDGASVGLSKSDFASRVSDAVPPFDTVTFEGFRPTFELLQEAVARLLGSDTSAAPPAA
jgi:RNA-directed DNA polymerase